jgi:hypothetical protein
MKKLIFLTCLLAVVLVPQMAQAKSSTYYTRFSISIQGQMTEKWSKATNHGTGYGCPARDEESGGATIRFATAKPFTATAGPYTGWHGNPPIKVVEDRYGQSRTANADGSAVDCGDFRPSYDGSACGHSEWNASLTLLDTTKFGFNFPADDPKYPFECPYPDKPPVWGDDDYWDSGYVIARNPSNVDWLRALIASKCDRHGKHCKPPKRSIVVHNVRHVSMPYANPKYPGAFEGSYEADIDWTATIRRLDRKVHVGR